VPIDATQVRGGVMVQHLERSPGRNDPCPCGSGKKYKRCCLLADSLQRSVRTVEDVVHDVLAADEVGDEAAARLILEQARAVIRHADLDTMLVARLTALPADDAETQLRAWWESEHDRYSGSGLAQVLLRDGRESEALDVLSASRSNDAPAEYWRLLAGLREEAGEYDAAVAALEMYARLAPEDADAWMSLADVQGRLGQTERALVSLRRAGDSAPELLAPRMLRVRLLAEEGRWRDVRDLAETLIDRTYEDAGLEERRDLRHILAQAYFVLGRFDAARAIWHAHLEDRPNDTETVFRLATLEVTANRPRRALAALTAGAVEQDECRALDIQLRALLALSEFPEAEEAAAVLERLDPGCQYVPLVRAAAAVADGDFAWAFEYLHTPPTRPYMRLWRSLRLDCLARLGRWSEVPAELKVTEECDDAAVLRAALGAMATGRLDLADRLAAALDDGSTMEARALSALAAPLRQQRRTDEVRRQQQVDQAEKQRRAAENRDLRRQVAALEQRNALLVDALSEAEEALKRMVERLGMEDHTTDWEAWLHDIGLRAHRDAVDRERRLAESSLRSLLGSFCWEGLSESVRTALRDAEQAYCADTGLTDSGTTLMGYARGLESAFKEALFRPAWEHWRRQPGNVARLQDESHDPSLGPFVRFLLQNSHLTLGSMAAALDRMGDARRTGVAIDLLRGVAGVDRHDERALADWRRTADRLAAAAEARNRPAHAAAVSRDEVRAFRELALGTDGLLRALAQFCP
jgi:tetratricopeptide (TPR) repeat protein